LTRRFLRSHRLLFEHRPALKLNAGAQPRHDDGGHSDRDIQMQQ
jgi:hypothetical protein